jgi:acyl carrier protein
MNSKIDTFVENFASQFDETPISQFQASTTFRELEEWSSMIALVIIAMVDEIYKVKLTGNEIKDSTTIEDLYQVVIAKVNG